ncbi:PREDICTED: uncharacterized protein LOC109187552 [Ipomoea nil]|uniref:uncharacterized protein LOC109187552 n=1 Tax=Ipomoea nil TaxID=35883 RepID=UPI000900F9BF|nr:PREDICTED: uncharacterized protein LOC109187552 [Ipomoea nil]
MKFLSELGACWGGATITPPPQTRTADNLPQPETAAGSQNRAATRQGRSINATKVVANWKPELHDICEEKVLSDSDLDGRIHGGAARMVKKSSPKIKPSSMTTKVSMLGEGFRKSYRIAMNAFVPSPYMI